MGLENSCPVAVIPVLHHGDSALRQCKMTRLSLRMDVCRIAPHVTMTLVALEALKAYEKKIGL